MAIRTNIDVSAFNILRYLILNIVIDIIVRKSLDTLEHFRRRLSLHRGHPVSVSGHRIDRYNLLRTPTSSHLLSASVLLFVTAVAYTVEIALEYAVDSRAVRYANRRNVTRVEYRTGVCSLDDIFTSDNALELAFIAEQCVILERNTYRLYRPIWVAGTGTGDDSVVSEDGLRVLCEAVEENRLYDGDGIYPPSITSKESPEVLELIRTLNENSDEKLGDVSHSLTVLKIARSSVQCIGFTSGLQNQETIVVQLVGCVNGWNENSSLVLTYGTSFVRDAGNRNGGGPSEWSTAVAFEVRTRIPRYFKGIREERPDSNADPRAYASFLARAFPQDAINLNKYAIVYRCCDQITLPVPNGKSWEEEYEFASSEVRVTATVEAWGMALATCWVVVVTVAKLLVSLVAARKKMPNNVFGEQQILRRWAEENNASEVDREGEAFLSVEDGSKSDRITAILRRVRKRSDDSDTVP